MTVHTLMRCESAEPDACFEQFTNLTICLSDDAPHMASTKIHPFFMIKVPEISSTIAIEKRLH